MKQHIARNRAFRKIKDLKECEDCGSESNLVRHHPDYNQPLKVKILCKKCHRNWHLKNKAKYGEDSYYSLRLPKWMFVELARKSAKTMYSINLLIVEAIKKDLNK